MSLEDNSKLQDELDALNAQITKQGSAVRQLKKDGAAAAAIEEAVTALQALKITSGSLTEKLKGGEPEFNRKSFDELVIRKMFVVPSFEIHGGVKGLFDLGPPATALKVKKRIDSFSKFMDGFPYSTLNFLFFFPGGHG
jgi:glycyl-tRNA synthetase